MKNGHNVSIIIFFRIYRYHQKIFFQAKSSSVSDFTSDNHKMTDFYLRYKSFRGSDGYSKHKSHCRGFPASRH